MGQLDFGDTSLALQENAVGRRVEWRPPAFDVLGAPGRIVPAYALPCGSEIVNLRPGSRSGLDDDRRGRCHLPLDALRPE